MLACTAIAGTSAAATATCFGGAARDPEHPCTNPSLSVTPAPDNLRSDIGPRCVRVPQQTNPLMCAFGAPEAKAKRTMALIGDSHTFHWRAALDIVGKKKRWRGISIQEPGCYFSAAAKYLEGSEERCAVWDRVVLAWLRKHREVSTVFVTHGTGETIDPPRGRTAAQTALSGFKRRWKSLPRSVKHIIVIRDNPKSTPATVNCVRDVVAAGIQRPGHACRLRRYIGLRRDYGVVAAKRLRSKRYQYVDLTHYFCGPVYCYPVIGGVLVNHDSFGHITQTYAMTLAPYLLRRLRTLMKSW